MDSASPMHEDVRRVAAIDTIPTLLDIISRTTKMGYVVVARVTEAQWLACAVRDDIAFGLMPGGELNVETTLCNEVRACGEEIVIDHFDNHPTYHNHPTSKLYGLQSYIAVPIRLADGSFWGTLCAIDPSPNRLDNDEVKQMFRAFARIISFHLDAVIRATASKIDFEEQSRVAALREEFIAVLGHDLRNPIAAIDAAVHVAGREPQSDKAKRALGLIAASSRRVTGLVDNLLDFARGRLGGGIPVVHDDGEGFQAMVLHVVEELRGRDPDRSLSVHLSLTEAVKCDQRRVAQLVSNLIGNALTHGKPGTPIRVEAITTAGRLNLTVANQAPPIPTDKLDGIFDPFSGGSRQGLGLGLYIAAEIARAHHGTLSVESNELETKFTFSMPLSD